MKSGSNRQREAGFSMAEIAIALFVLAVGLLAIVSLFPAAVQFGGSRRLLGPVHVLGRLAMADVFLIALYIVAAKGVGVGRVETAWGLWLFTACVLGSLAVAHLTERALKRPVPPV